MKSETLSLEQLLLDPNNYRLIDLDGFVYVANEKRYVEQNVQSNVEKLLKRDGENELRVLKDSLLSNGYIPLEPIVVMKYKYDEKLFVVVEGNRRTVAMRWLKKDSDSGIDIPGKLLESFSALECLIIDPQNDKEAHILRQTLMGLRHVSGVKEWGGYQSAKLLQDLVDNYNLKIETAAAKIGLSPREAMRRYRVLKALDQMSTDDEFGELCNPSLFRFFWEALDQSIIREWLGWNEKQMGFTNEQNVQEFYRLITPQSVEYDDIDSRLDRGTRSDPKLKTHKDVRDLKLIIPNEEALQVLLDSERTLAEALSYVRINQGGDWQAKVKAASKAIKNIPISEVREFNNESISPIKDLHDALSTLINDWKSITSLK